MAHSLSKPSIGSLAIYKKLGLNGASTLETASADGMGSEIAQSPSDCSETIPEASILARDYFKLFDSDKIDDEVVLAHRQVDLRERLNGHWANDVSRSCAGCQQLETYVHGVFRFTKPSQSPTPISKWDVDFKAKPMSRSI